MTDRDPDLDGDERALAEMTHGELVALVNRLYIRLGEKRISTSTALASTDDEVRDTIRMVRRRLAAKMGAPAELLPPITSRRSVRDLSGADSARPSDRVFVVLFARDSALVDSARGACRARGVTLVSVASHEIMAALVASMTPTHLVIVGEEFDRALARDLENRGVHVRRCLGPGQAMQALAEIGA